VVVAETSGGYVLLLAPEDLDAWGGSIEAMVDAIERTAQRHGLVWTTPETVKQAETRGSP
jgi:hypothetical protein